MVTAAGVRFNGAILAAGAGMRLRPATGGLPKPLVEVGGVSMLERQAAALFAAGARKVTAIINTETAHILERRGGCELPIEIVVRDTTSSMESLLVLGGVISSGADPVSDPMLFATVDAIAPRAELNRFAAEAFAPSGSARFDGALAVVRWRGDKRPLFASVAPGGAITALGDGPSDLVTAGFYSLPPGIFGLAPIARSRGLDALRRFLALAIESGWRLRAIEIVGAIDVDEGGDLDDARALLSGQSQRTA